MQIATTHFDGPNGAVITNNFFTDRDFTGLDAVLVVVACNHDDNLSDVETAGDDWTRISQETVETANLQAEAIFCTYAVFQLVAGVTVASFGLNLSYAAVIDATLLEMTAIQGAPAIGRQFVAGSLAIDATPS